MKSILIRGMVVVVATLATLMIPRTTSLSAGTPEREFMRCDVTRVVESRHQTGSADLGGTSWQLVKFQGSDDTTRMPDDKTKYTIAFGHDGRVSARIDCNRGMGSWKSTEPNRLQFGPLALSRAMCPRGSLHDQMARHWESIRSYIINDGHLFLSLMADGGIYEFEPIGSSKPSAKLPVASRGPVNYECTQPQGGTDALSVTFYQTTPALALVERANQIRPAFQVRAASGAKYEGPDVSFWDAGREAQVRWSDVELKCKMVEGGLSDSAMSFVGKKWKLTEVNGNAVTTGKAYIEFDGQSKRFSGDGGCNRITGSFQVEGMRIRFSKGTSTMMACMEGEVQRIEGEFLKGLEQVTEFQVQGDVLRLLASDRPILVFKADATQTGGGSSQEARVTGTVSYRERIALTPNAVIEVKLLDVSRADAPAVTIAEQTINPAGRQVPIAFELNYDPSRINNRNRYGIQVRILEGGRVRFINTQAHPVLTGGHPNMVNVIVNPVGK